MGEHLRNPVALANAPARREVTTMPIGEGYALLGLTLEPMMSDDEHVCAVLTIVGVRESRIGLPKPAKLVLGELGRISLADLRAKLAEAIDGPKEPQ